MPLNEITTVRAAEFLVHKLPLSARSDKTSVLTRSNMTRLRTTLVRSRIATVIRCTDSMRNC